MRAQIKILTAFGHERLNILHDEMKRIHSTEAFRNEVKKLSSEGFLLTKCDYRFILDFCLELIKRSVKSQMSKILHKTVENKTRSLCLKKCNGEKFFNNFNVQKLPNVHSAELPNKDFSINSASVDSNGKVENQNATNYLNCVVCKMIFENKFSLLEHCNVKHKIDLSSIKIVNVVIALPKLRFSFSNDYLRVSNKKRKSTSNMHHLCYMCRLLCKSNSVLLKHYKKIHKTDISMIKFIDININVQKLGHFDDNSNSVTSVKKKAICVLPNSCLLCKRNMVDKPLLLKHYEKKHKINLTGMKFLDIKIALLKVNLKLALLKLNLRVSYTQKDGR